MTASHYLGKCPSCLVGIAVEAAPGKPVPCPECGTLVRLTLVKGTYSAAHDCDVMCLYARRPMCVCQCGGANHGVGYLIDLSERRYRVPPPDKIVAKIVKTREQIAARAEMKRTAAAAVVEDERARFAADYPEVVALLANLPEDGNAFLLSLAEQLASKGRLSDRQADAALSAGERDAERAARKAAEPEPAPAPAGKVEVTGVILSMSWQASPFAYSSGAMKMLVLADDGYKVWITRPNSLSDAKRGDRVAFTAEIEPSADDPCFAYGKRPAKARALTPA